MQPTPMLAGALLLFALVAAPRAEAALPLLNGSCPGGLEIHADEGGPVYVNGREAVLKRFNDHYYEARDAGSGTTVSIDTSGEVARLSYTGPGRANGVCSVAAAPGPEHAQAPATTGAAEVTCESRDHRKQECDMDTAGEVRLVRQLSHDACVEGQTWGLARHSVWVTDGCRAVFRNVSATGSHGHHRDPAPPAAGAGDLQAACDARAGARGTPVTRVPVGSASTELIIDYPDGRFLCMVRNDGLVTSLTRLRAR